MYKDLSKQLACNILCNLCKLPCELGAIIITLLGTRKMSLSDLPKVKYSWRQGSDPVVPSPKPQRFALIWRPETLGLQTEISPHPKQKPPVQRGLPSLTSCQSLVPQPHTDFSLGSCPGLTTAINTPHMYFTDGVWEGQNNSLKLTELKLGQTETAL